MRRIDDAMKFRMFFVWAIALIVCLVPHPMLSESRERFVHQPLFLLLYPLAMACIPLFVPERMQLSEEERADRIERKRKANGWTILLQVSVVAAAFFGWGVVDGMRDSSMSHAERTRTCLEFAGLMVLPLAGVWVSVRKLKKLGQLWY